MLMQPTGRAGIILGIIVTGLLLIGVYFAFYRWYSQSPLTYPPTATPTAVATPNIPQRVTLSGEIICLPHKDTKGPQTLECAIGLTTNQGDNYALNTQLMSQDMPTYQTGDQIEAGGIITPIEILSADHWQKYDVKGIFSITDYQVLIP